MGVEPTKPSRSFASGQRDSNDACSDIIHWDIQWPARSYSSRVYWLFARYRCSRSTTSSWCTVGSPRSCLDQRHMA